MGVGFSTGSERRNCCRGRHRSRRAGCGRQWWRSGPAAHDYGPCGACSSSSACLVGRPSSYEPFHTSDDGWHCGPLSGDAWAAGNHGRACGPHAYGHTYGPYADRHNCPVPGRPGGGFGDGPDGGLASCRSEIHDGRRPGPDRRGGRRAGHSWRSDGTGDPHRPDECRGHHRCDAPRRGGRPCRRPARIRQRREKLQAPTRAPAALRKRKSSRVSS
jgi:hypothetical protein